MAQTVFLKLKINGKAVAGESTVASLGREGTIECAAFDHAAVSRRDAGGTHAGRRAYEPIRVVKLIDRATPLLFKALCGNESCECEFLFYRPDPAGSGQEQHFFTIALKGAYVSQIAYHSEDPRIGGELAPPMTETVSWTLRDIRVTYADGGIEYHDFLPGA